MENRFHIILNPVAGAGKGKHIRAIIQKQMEDLQINDYDIFFSKAIGDAMLLAKEYGKNDKNIIIAAGGDGTINEVLNGLLLATKNNASSRKMGIINCGSGAGFAQTIGLPSDIKTQIDIFIHGQTKPVDVGLVSFTNNAGAIENRYFINECQIGIGGSVVSKVNLQHKRFGGKMAFGYVAVSQLAKYQATNMKVTIDDKLVTNNKKMGVTIGNGRYCGGGMQLTPNARVDDGFLDVLNISDMNLLQRLSAFSKVYSGRHINTPYFTMHKAKRIDIESDIPVWVEADGELLGKTPCSIKILPGAIGIFAPINVNQL